MPTAALYEVPDPRADPTGDEVKAWFVRIRGALRYAEEACKLEEEWRDVEERRLSAYRRCEAAMREQLSAQNRIGFWIILAAGFVAMLVANVVLLVHNLL
jgi:ferric-dicitrate binding protein FerR (iron transport regulator)